jgi:uncharacterized protein (TIGR03435 family)
MPRPDDRKPDFSPSYALHILPSGVKGTGNYGGDDFWSLQGFDVKGVISVVYDLNTVRIRLPASVDDRKRYDLSMVLPLPESKESICERFRQGIQDHFHLAVTRETRLMDVYVVTALDPRLPAAKARSTGGGVRFFHIGFETFKDVGDGGREVPAPTTFNLTAIRSISIDGTIDDFCEALERQLDRPLVNGTDLDGEFAFRIEPSQHENSDFLDRLRDQLGLVIARGQRNVELLVFNPC